MPENSNGDLFAEDVEVREIGVEVNAKIIRR
jgi:hypothetical protein